MLSVMIQLYIYIYMLYIMSLLLLVFHCLCLSWLAGSLLTPVAVHHWLCISLLSFVFVFTFLFPFTLLSTLTLPSFCVVFVYLFLVSVCPLDSLTSSLYFIFVLLVCCSLSVLFHTLTHILSDVVANRTAIIFFPTLFIPFLYLVESPRHTLIYIFVLVFVYALYFVLCYCSILRSFPSFFLCLLLSFVRSNPSKGLSELKCFPSLSLYPYFASLALPLRVLLLSSMLVYCVQ